MYTCVLCTQTHTPVRRGCATGRLNILALVLNRGSAIDKALWGRFTSARGDEQSEEPYLAKVAEIARVVLAETGQ